MKTLDILEKRGRVILSRSKNAQLVFLKGLKAVGFKPFWPYLVGYGNVSRYGLVWGDKVDQIPTSPIFDRTADDGLGKKRPFVDTW